MSQGEAEIPAREAGLGDFSGGCGLAPSRRGLPRAGGGGGDASRDSRNVISLYTDTSSIWEAPGKAVRKCVGPKES